MAKDKPHVPPSLADLERLRQLDEANRELQAQAPLSRAALERIDRAAAAAALAQHRSGQHHRERKPRRKASAS